MIRWLLALLVLANAGFWAWSHGHLAMLGWAPASEREPQRLAQQIEPDQIHLINGSTLPPPMAGAASAPNAAAAAGSTPSVMASAPTAASATAAASAPGTASATMLATTGQCLQAGLFSDQQIATLRGNLGTLPAGTWQFKPATEPGRWMVFMGKYANAEMLARKKAELSQIHVGFEDVQTPALQPGLSLGYFNTQLSANQKLADLARHGVHTARVVQERPDVHGQTLVIAHANDALAPQLKALAPKLFGKSLRSCAPGVSG